MTIEKSSELILKIDGMPFSTDKAAKACMGSKRLSLEEYKVIECQKRGEPTPDEPNGPLVTGFAIQKIEVEEKAGGEEKPPASGGKPLPPALDTWKQNVAKRSDFCIDACVAYGHMKANMALPSARKMLAKLEPTEEEAEELNLSVEEFAAGDAEAKKIYKVRFHAATGKDQTPDVILAVRGEVLVIKRQEEVFIPGAYVEVANNTKYPHYEQKPGEDRKTAAFIQTYPFDTIPGEWTWKDYAAMKDAGTAITLARKG